MTKWNEKTYEETDKALMEMEWQIVNSEKIDTLTLGIALQLPKRPG